MAGHTPGPWQADDCFMENCRVVRVAMPAVNGAPSTTIAECWVSEPDDDDEHLIGVIEAERNARLIAAAPDLKDSTSALLFWIAQGNFSALPIPAIEYMHKAIKEAEAAIAKAEGK